MRTVLCRLRGGRVPGRELTETPLATHSDSHHADTARARARKRQPTIALTTTLYSMSLLCHCHVFLSLATTAFLTQTASCNA